MSQQQSHKVHLATLFEKVSAKGNRYYYGRLGAASVVMFLDERSESADPKWQLYVQEPPPQNQNRPPAGDGGFRSSTRARARGDDLNDDLPPQLAGAGMP